MKPETEIDETGSFGEPEEKPAPFWKRSVWGISVATWGYVQSCCSQPYGICS
ncbi:Uncharacterised protein (plasmid) [Escherichia coli]|nr:Uncharacterised protein [Escherichia coli]